VYFFLWLIPYLPTSHLHCKSSPTVYWTEDTNNLLLHHSPSLWYATCISWPGTIRWP